MLTATQQARVVLKVGDTVAPPGLLSLHVAEVAGEYNGLDTRVAQLGPGYSLEMLYTERDLILLAMGACRANVQERTADQQLMAEQEAARLQAMYANVQAEIVRVEALARRSRPALVGQLTRVQPIPNPYGIGVSPDASDPALQGSPYYPYPGGLNGPPVTLTNP